jgi:hypothetical protein
VSGCAEISVRIIPKSLSGCFRKQCPYVSEICTQTGDISEFDDKLVRKLVEKAIVYDDRLMVEFKSGLEIEVKL